MKYNSSWYSYPAISNPDISTALVVDPILCSPVTGIEQRDPEFGVKVYPNPANTTVYVDVNQADKSTKVLIYNLQGQLIHTQAVSSRITPVNIADFTNGLYILKVESEKGVSTNKFIKE